jgi:hypothetical protein
VALLLRLLPACLCGCVGPPREWLQGLAGVLLVVCLLVVLVALLLVVALLLGACVRCLWLQMSR